MRASHDFVCAYAILETGSPFAVKLFAEKQGFRCSVGESSGRKLGNEKEIL